MINGNVNLVSKTLASSFRISASGVVQTFHLLCREIFGIKIEFEYCGNFNISKIEFLEKKKLLQKSEFNPFNRLTRNPFKSEKIINNNKCNEKQNPNVKNEMKNSK